MYDVNLKNELAKSIMDFRFPRYSELPDMGLYLEQVVRYVNRFLTLINGSDITPSMVSNYVKQKVVPAPRRKLYGADSIAYLIFIAYMKPVASIENIRILEEIQKNSYSLQVAYDYFCSEFENLLQYVYGIKPEPDTVGNDATPEKELLRSALLSITYRIYFYDYLGALQNSRD